MAGKETYRDKAEFNSLSNLANSLPDVSSEEEDQAMETDPRYLMSQSLMKALLNPHAVEEQATVVEEGSVLEGNESGGSDGLDVTPFCIPCEGNVCFFEDKQQVTFFPSNEEYYEELDEASRKQLGDLDEDKRLWSSEEEGAEVVTNLGAEDEESEALGGLLGSLNEGSLKHSLNLDGHGKLCREEEGEEAAGTGVGLAVTEVGTEDDGAGEQVNGDSHSGLVNNVSGGSDPPDTLSESENSQGGGIRIRRFDPRQTTVLLAHSRMEVHKVTKEADSDKEDGGYGSGADSTVHQSERDMVCFPPLAGGSAQK